MVVLRLLAALLLVGGIVPAVLTGPVSGDGVAILVDHTSANITQIPEAAIVAAKATLHIAYGHTSHGNQIVNGMKHLVAFANGGGKGLDLPDNIFAYNHGGTDGKLDLQESYDLVNEPAGLLVGTGGQYTPYDVPPTFVDETHEYLGPSDNRNPEHANINVFMWSWCREADDEYRAGVVETNYLIPMSNLEAEYPDVTFVYMTSPNGLPTESDADIEAANTIIRNYCQANGKVLYDFGDIESWDPDGVYYPFADEACDYYSDASRTTKLGNWAVNWQNSHTLGVDWYNCAPQHSPNAPLNGNLKAYTAWWLFARLAGWNPDDIQAPLVTLSSPNGGEQFKKDDQHDITWTATDDRDVTFVNISYSTDNGASYTDIATGQANDGSYAWTIPDTTSLICLVKVEASDEAGNVGQDESDAIFEIYSCIPGDANNDFCVDVLDITSTERIILGLDPPTADANANGDGGINILDITEIEHIISGS